MVHTLLLVAAVLLFIAAALGAQTKIALQPLGLACCVVAVLLWGR